MKTIIKWLKKPIVWIVCLILLIIGLAIKLIFKSKR